MLNQQHASGGSTAEGPPEPALAERARTLVAVGRIGGLSTHSRKLAGYPFGSMMPYAADGQGRPVFFISSMAVHSQNLVEDPRSSLLIMQPDVTGDPLGAGRVTILGTTTHVTPEQARDLYLSRHENAKFWQDYSDFAFYRLEVAGVYFIGGFGVMGWVSVDDYTNAKPDPLAEAAMGIIQHMNADHAEALTQIAGHYAGEAVDEAAMTAVDRLGFHLRLKSGDRVYGRRIPFIREVTSRDDARSVLVEMVRRAKTS